MYNRRNNDMKLLHSSRLTYLPIILTLLLFSACSDDNPDANAVAMPPHDKVYADLILRGAKIYTVNSEQPWAEAMAVKHGKIMAVGNEAELRQHQDSNTKVMTLDGGMILPGFHDAHTHVIMSGLEMAGCPLHELKSVAAILDKVKACAETSGNGWVSGSGWLLSLFPPDGKPGRELLDNIVPDMPVYLDGVDGHSAWVNTLALQLAGIDNTTPDPKGGIIERDPISGAAIGTLREEAMAMVESKIPPKTHEEYVQAGRYAVQLHNSVGITSMIDASFLSSSA